MKTTKQLQSASKMAEVRWANHGSNWPEGTRECTKCKTIKPLDKFHKHSDCKFGVAPVCKTCCTLKHAEDYSNKSLEAKILERAKRRSYVSGIELDITIDDIKIPDKCPVFGTEFVVNTQQAASIDRIDSTKGYVRGNIAIISRRANTIKNDATVEELKQVIRYMEEI